MDHEAHEETEANFIDLTQGDEDYVLLVQVGQAQMHFEVKGNSIDEMLEAVLDAVDHDLAIVCHKDADAALMLPRIPSTAVVQIVTAARWAELVKEAQTRQSIATPSGGRIVAPSKIARR